MNGLKTVPVTVPEWGGRDAGKTFVIHEQPAIRAEKWGWRMLLALKGTGGMIPEPLEESIARLGMVGVAVRGVNAFLAAAVKFEEIEPLLDEMLTWARIVRDPRHPEVASALQPNDVVETRVLMWLRGEILGVHVGFSPADVFSRLTSAMERWEASQSTQTSLPSSGTSSPAG